MAKLDDRIASLQAKLQTLKQQQQNKERAERQAERQRVRKAENSRKYALGGLFKIIEIFDLDTGALLGALLSIRPSLNDPEKFAEFKRAGDALLAQREQGRKEVASTSASLDSAAEAYLQ